MCELASEGNQITPFVIWCKDGATEIKKAYAFSRKPLISLGAEDGI